MKQSAEEIQHAANNHSTSNKVAGKMMALKNTASLGEKITHAIKYAGFHYRALYKLSVSTKLLYTGSHFKCHNFENPILPLANKCLFPLL
jgi:hypothetical protein